MEFEKDEEGRYLCPQCAGSYKRKWHVVEHVRFYCGMDPQFECTICSKKYRRKHELINHQSAVHNI